MRFVVQVVSKSDVKINGEIKGSIKKGFMVLIGVGQDDNEAIADKMVNKLLAKNKALRRSLCLMNDGRYCIIDTDMSVAVDDFAEALRQYGVREAISLMGSGAALRWAEDKDGRKHIAGADEYEFPDAINYIVWEKPL